MRFKSFRKSSIIMRKISVSVQKNHNIDAYLAKALQDFLNGKTSDNDEYEDLNWKSKKKGQSVDVK